MALCFCDFQSQVLKRKKYNPQFCTDIPSKIIKSTASRRMLPMFDCRWIRVISSSASRKGRELNTRTRKRESPSSSPSALRWSGNTVRSLTSRDGSRSYGTTLFYFEPLSTLFPRLFIRRSRWAVPAGCRRQKALCSQGALPAVPPAHVLCLRHFLAVPV